ncbi:MAG TPA: hypothetical protein VI321_10460 [Burkholderiales bacterium]
MRPRIHAITAAFGILASSGTFADKGPNGGPATGVGFGNGRGGPRFIDAAGAGPANAFDQHAQLARSAGLEFKAAGNPQAAPGQAGERTRSPENRSRSAKPRDNAALSAPGTATSGDEKIALAEAEVASAFAPWKVTDKDGKPVEKKAGQECGAK